MDYSEMLKQKEWDDKCSAILKREFYRCKKCGAPGYRNMTCVSFNSRTEINKLLKGVTIDELDIIDFIESIQSKEAEARKLHATFKEDENGNQYVLNGYYCPEMKRELLDRKHILDNFPPIPFSWDHEIFENPFSEKPFRESDIFGWAINSYNHKFKTVSNSRFSIGTIYKFPYKLTDHFVVSI